MIFRQMERELKSAPADLKYVQKIGCEHERFVDECYCSEFALVVFDEEMPC